MKHLIYFYLLFLFLVGCKKKLLSDEEFAKKQNGNNSVYVNLNGQPYVSIIILDSKTATFSFALRKIKNNNLRGNESSLILQNLKYKLGIQTIYKTNNDSTDLIKSTSNFYTSTYDGDVLADVYGIIESDSANNYFNIVEEKNNFSEISGVFSLTFVRTGKGNATQFPDMDTVRLRNGSFHLFLK